MFVKESKGTDDMCTLAQRWGSATAKEKEKYIEKSNVEYSKEGVLLKVDCFQEYPICRECVPPAASLAKGHAEDWSCTVGKYCCHDTSDVLIEPKQNELCGEKFRFDMCEEDMSAQDLQAHAALQDLLRRSCLDVGANDSFVSVHKGVQRILLYWVTFEVDLDIDSAQGAWLWQLCTQANPMTVVFLANRVEHSVEVKEGKSFTIVPHLVSLLDDADVATMLFQRTRVRVHRVDYKLTSLLSFTVNAFEDVTNYLRSLRRGRKRAVRDPVGALVMGILKRPCRTAGARRSRKTKRRRKTHEDDGEDDGDDEDEALDSDGDEGDGGGDNSSEDDGEDDDGEEDKGPEEDPVELVKADWEGAHEEMPVELYYDWDTCQYKLVDKHGPVQGKAP
jgi:hypothetical protein